MNGMTQNEQGNQGIPIAKGREWGNFRQGKYFWLELCDCHEADQNPRAHLTGMHSVEEPDHH